VPDRLDATLAALQSAAQTHDLILTSGGVSVGEEDHIKPAVQALGRLDLWQIAIKPGKPFAYGRVQDAHFIGLPGNPVSSFVTLLLLVRPFLLQLQGVSQSAPEYVVLPAHFTWPRPINAASFAGAAQCGGRPGPAREPKLRGTDFGGVGRRPGGQPAGPDHCSG